MLLDNIRKGLARQHLYRIHNFHQGYKLPLCSKNTCHATECTGGSYQPCCKYYVFCIRGFRDVGWDLLLSLPYNLLRKIHFHLAPEVTSDRQLSFFKFYKKTQIKIIYTISRTDIDNIILYKLWYRRSQWTIKVGFRLAHITNQHWIKAVLHVRAYDYTV